MNPTIEQKIRRQYFAYANTYDHEELKTVMSGYLGALWDFGHITEDEYWQAYEQVDKQLKKEVA